MPNSGDIIDLDLGLPVGRETGFVHPAVVVTAQRVLDENPAVIHVVPLTTTIRSFRTEIQVNPDSLNQLEAKSAAQCQHVRSVSVGRVTKQRGNVGPVVLTQVREAIALLLDLPG